MAGVGQTGETAPRSGFIKFEFDKDWIGAKGYVPFNLAFLAQIQLKRPTDMSKRGRTPAPLHHLCGAEPRSTDFALYEPELPAWFRGRTVR
jgi:hypothetical protein